MGDVHLQWPESRPPDEALSRLLAGHYDTIEGQGYSEGRRTRRSVSFTRRRLFYPRNERFTILATEGENGGSVVMVEGSMRRKLRSTFAEIAEQGNSNGSKARDWAEMERELRKIYELVGKPSAFAEAKGKVQVLADCLSNERGIAQSEALRLAYERSLTEHRDYLTAKGISN
jgi:hypothetical protein